MGVALVISATPIDMPPLPVGSIGTAAMVNAFAPPSPRAARRTSVHIDRALIR